MFGYEWFGDFFGLDIVLVKGCMFFKDVYFIGMVWDNKC